MVKKALFFMVQIGRRAARAKDLMTSARQRHGSSICLFKLLKPRFFPIIDVIQIGVW